MLEAHQQQQKAASGSFACATPSYDRWQKRIWHYSIRSISSERMASSCAASRKRFHFSLYVSQISNVIEDMAGGPLRHLLLCRPLQSETCTVQCNCIPQSLYCQETSYFTAGSLTILTKQCRGRFSNLLSRFDSDSGIKVATHAEAVVLKLRVIFVKASMDVRDMQISQRSLEKQVDEVWGLQKGLSQSASPFAVASGQSPESEDRCKKRREHGLKQR